MFRRILMMAPLGLIVLALTACDSGVAQQGPRGTTSAQPGSAPPMYAQADPTTMPSGRLATRVASDAVVIPDGRLTVFVRQDVPSQKDSVVTHIYVKEGDRVTRWQQLAQLDARVADADREIKIAKIAAARADLDASEKTRDEAYQKKLTAERLGREGGDRLMSREDVRAAILVWQRYFAEAVSKKEGVSLAIEERKQADVVVEMHQVNAAVGGRIRNIYKKEGEAVKNLETVMTLENTDRLRVESLVDVQNLGALRARDVLLQVPLPLGPLTDLQIVRPGMRVLVEPTQTDSPDQTLPGHFQAVTAVAVSNDPKNPLIVSSSEDGTVRVWMRGQRTERLVLRHPTGVRCVTTTPKGAEGNLALSGAADGKGRLWDLASNSTQPLRELKGHHRGAITAVAFSPDGKWCVTGGEDLQIRLWDVGSGEMKYTFPAGHRGAVTSLQFTPDGKLVSAGRDNTLRVWNVSNDRAEQAVQPLDQRSGDVPVLGVSGDGKHVLFDQGKRLRVLSVPGGLNEAVLQNPSSAASFTTFAIFSPLQGEGQDRESKLILTVGGAAEGRVQLWRAPSATDRGHELRQFVGSERSPATCAAFAPDCSFAVTGTRDGQVMIWPVPKLAAINRQFPAELILAERSLDSNTARQARVWAVVNNPDDVLLSGSTATLAVPPEAKLPEPVLIFANDPASPLVK